jgi:hypothetical protein
VRTGLDPAARPAVVALGVLATLAALAGCGGGSSTGRPAARATAAPAPTAHAARPGCQPSVRAALDRLPGLAGTRSHLLAGDEETATCAYRAGRERLTVEIDAVPQAYMAYETANVHQVQANVGRTEAAKPDEYPKQVDGVGVEAAWIPSEHQLITTSATPHRGGAFIRVTIRRRSHGAPAERTVARRAALASLRTAPRGPG